ARPHERGGKNEERTAHASGNSQAVGQTATPRSRRELRTAIIRACTSALAQRIFMRAREGPTSHIISVWLVARARAAALSSIALGECTSSQGRSPCAPAGNPASHQRRACRKPCTRTAAQ